MLTITPAAAAAMPAAAAWAHRIIPVWFTARVRATLSGSTSSSAAGRLMPALLTRISSGAGAAANSARTLSGSVTSTAAKRCPAAAPPANSATTRAPASASRSATTTRAPTSANARATARPIPEAAPVTSTVFSASCNQPSIVDAASNISPRAQERALAWTKIPHRELEWLFGVDRYPPRAQDRTLALTKIPTADRSVRRRWQVSFTGSGSGAGVDEDPCRHQERAQQQARPQRVAGDPPAQKGAGQRRGEEHYGEPAGRGSAPESWSR